MSTSQERFTFESGIANRRFNISTEKEKMRQTNFKVGELKGGYDSCYNRQFVRNDSALKSRIFIGKEAKNALESHHWDHSRSYSQNFTTEQANKFNTKRDDLNFTQNKFFGYQNTLNQIDTHYKLGRNHTNFETTTQGKFRDNSADRGPIFRTRRVKDY